MASWRKWACGVVPVESAWRPAGLLPANTTSAAGATVAMSSPLARSGSGSRIGLSRRTCTSGVDRMGEVVSTHVKKYLKPQVVDSSKKYA